MARLKYYNEITGKWEYADKAGSDKDGAHYAMKVIASGVHTVTSDDSAAEKTGVSFMFNGATLEKIREYKAIFVQVSAEENINNSGSVRCFFWKQTPISNVKVDFASFRYGLKTHRALLFFADKEHYAGMVIANSSSSNKAERTHATTEGSTEQASFGVVDLSTLSDDYTLSFEASNCTVGNKITYQVIGLAEETANFS